MDDLKKDYTIIIVTHNMQQAARVSSWTAFMWLGRLIEYGETTTMFTTPGEKLQEGRTLSISPQSTQRSQREEEGRSP